MAGSFPLGMEWAGRGSIPGTDGEHPPPPGLGPGLLFPARRDGREGPGAASPSLGAPGEGRAHPWLCLQVTPFPEPYRDTLHPYKISEQDTDVRASPVPSVPSPHPLSPQAELCAPRGQISP